MEKDFYINCQKCGHGSVCKHKDKCLEFLNKELARARDLAPDFVNVGASCKYFYADRSSTTRELR